MILSRFAALSVSLIPVSLFQWEEIGMEIHFFGGRRPRIQNAMTMQLSTLCCRDSLCSTMPSSCTAECTDALIPYFRDCAGELLVHSPALMGRLTELANACSAGGH